MGKKQKHQLDQRQNMQSQQSNPIAKNNFFKTQDPMTICYACVSVCVEKKRDNNTD